MGGERRVVVVVVGEVGLKGDQEERCPPPAQFVGSVEVVFRWSAGLSVCLLAGLLKCL